MTVLLLVAPSPAFATHQPKHDGALAGAASITEDTDSDGVPNNISDEGDNLHPSGKDRSVEHGGSGDQGRSASTPDQNGRGPERDNGGTDKPNGPGGADIYDQDRNNGCGNDDDFDDDNEGWCGGKSKNQGESEDQVKSEEQGKPGQEAQAPPLGIVAGQPGGPPTGGAVPGAGPPVTQPSGQVLGELVTRGTPEVDVWAESQQRGALGGTLAFTGFPLVAVTLFALILLAGGIALVTAGRAGRGSSSGR
jgi:hypothetical protein